MLAGSGKCLDSHYHALPPFEELSGLGVMLGRKHLAIRSPAPRVIFNPVLLFVDFHDPFVVLHLQFGDGEGLHGRRTGTGTRLRRLLVVPLLGGQL